MLDYAYKHNKIFSNIERYVEQSKKLMINKGDVFTIINNNSANVYYYNSGRFYNTRYSIDSLMNLNVDVSCLTEYNAETIHFKMVNDHFNSDLTQSSNFIGSPYEPSEILNAIRLINIQAFTFIEHKKHNKFKHRDYYTIQNIFPSCLFSQINFESTENENEVKVNIIFEKLRERFNHIEEMRESTFTISVIVKNSFDNFVNLYDAFMELYVRYSSIIKK